MQRPFLFVLIVLALVGLPACDGGTSSDDGDGGGDPPEDTWVIVVDKMNNRLVAFDAAGNQAAENVAPTRPTDADLQPGSNHLWLADYANDRVSRYALGDGIELLDSSAEGRVNDPYTVAALPNGNCWCSDRVNGAFVRFSSGGVETARLNAGAPTRHTAFDAVAELVWLADENGSLYAVDAYYVGDAGVADVAEVTVDDLGILRGLIADGPNGRLWLSDIDGDRVLCLNAADGTVLQTFAGLDDPYGLAVDGAGDCWAALRGAGEVVELKADGTTGASYSGLAGPVDTAVGSDGTVWVVEENGGVLKGLKDGAVTVEVGGLSQPVGVEVYEPAAR
jgi:DNA-binding beta-propeller fold protein YncE